MGRALVRLLSVQGAWSYERMTGVGMGYAAEPLLRDLATTDLGRHRAATARSAEFFNCHPYLAGLALGATVRAEHDGVPGEQIQRLRTALCSPLGALGDQVFWAGLVPLVVAAALVAVTLGAEGYALATAVLLFNVLRLLVARWAIITGLGAGMQVGTAISASWLPRAAVRVATPAIVVVGVALPMTAAWLLASEGVVSARALGAAGFALLAAATIRRLGGARWAAPAVALALAAAVAAWVGVAG